MDWNVSEEIVGGTAGKTTFSSATHPLNAPPSRRVALGIDTVFSFFNWSNE
jgi:hypothetical protein